MQNVGKGNHSKQPNFSTIRISGNLFDIITKKHFFFPFHLHLFDENFYRLLNSPFCIDQMPNSTGKKLQPLVIGKSAQPWCFKKIKIEKLPVMYRSKRKAWMTTDLMTEWLKKIDKQMKAQGRKILLFLDNAPSHPHLTLHNVKLAILPANTTALAQPMDQGIIQTLKLEYRKRQLQCILGQWIRLTKRVLTY